MVGFPLRFSQVDVFACVPLLADPLAVIHDGDRLTDRVTGSLPASPNGSSPRVGCPARMSRARAADATATGASTSPPPRGRSGSVVTP